MTNPTHMKEQTDLVENDDLSETENNYCQVKKNNSKKLFFLSNQNNNSNNT